MRYITAIIFASLATALVVIYAYPTYEDMGRLKKRGEELTKSIEMAGQAQTKIDDLERKYKTFPEGANERMSTMLPESLDDVRLTMDITDLAAAHGLSLANPTIKKLAGDKSNPVQEYSVSLSVEAPYSTFRRFLNDIEYWLQLRDITSLSITAGENAAVPMKIQMEFTTYALH